MELKPTSPVLALSQQTPSKQKSTRYAWLVSVQSTERLLTLTSLSTAERGAPDTGMAAMATRTLNGQKHSFPRIPVR